MLSAQLCIRDSSSCCGALGRCLGSRSRLQPFAREPALTWPLFLDFRDNFPVILCKSFQDGLSGSLLQLLQGCVNYEPNFFFLMLQFYFIYFFIQQVLISHQFYTHQCLHVIPNHPIHHTPPTPTAFPPWCPYICSLHLCLSFCPANWFICTIFLGSTYMR